jgi:NAD(P)-dependent dehydrogenase (short-subunit alcohol dehydrogenase family)
MTIDLKPLDQQVIVVFGASSGIGRATALAAAERCAQVVEAGRDQAALDSLVEETASAPGEVVVGTADAADQGEVEAIAELAVSRFGRIDTWAHVAGIAVYGPFEDITPEEFRRVIDVDLLGPVHGARAALPHLRANGGAFVVVSSEIAKRGFPLATSYSAAKHGVDGFLEALRVELQHAGAPVSVTQVMPAAIATPFFENARSRLGVRASGPPPVYGPEKVAEAILSAAEHPRRDVVVGGAAKVQLAIQRISPLLTDAFVRATAFRLQRSTEAKAPGDDALFDTPEGEDRVRGVVSNTHR